MAAPLGEELVQVVEDVFDQRQVSVAGGALQLVPLHIPLEHVSVRRLVLVQQIGSHHLSKELHGVALIQPLRQPHHRFCTSHIDLLPSAPSQALRMRKA